jgi:sulfur carrier protein ThiS adenylyltransferase
MTAVFYELKNSMIGIAGLGGLGSNVAVALVRTGPGRLVLADFDIVEEPNLNRQQYFLDQVGHHKVDACMANLLRIRPDSDLVGHKVSRMPDTAIVSVSGLAGYGRSNDIVTRRIHRRHVLVGDGVSGIGPGIPLTASRVGVAAHHQANAILELLLDADLRSLWARRNNGAGI